MDDFTRSPYASFAATLVEFTSTQALFGLRLGTLLTYRQRESDGGSDEAG